MSRFKRFLPLLITGTVLLLGGLAYLAIDRYGLGALVSAVGVTGVAGIIFAESGLLIGFFLPGDSLLFTTGFLVQLNVLPFNIHLLAFILFLAAALGDSVGYTFGRRMGSRLFTRRDSLIFRHENVTRAREFYDKYGAKTIIIARFVPVVRTFAPIVAGIGNMRYRTFVTFNLIGAFLWAAGLTYLGYFAGNIITDAGINIEYVIVGIIVLSILPPLIHIFKEKKNRTALVQMATSQISALFKKSR